MKRKRNSMAKTLKGNLLLDGGGLFGSFFHRTVVLICEHDDNGAFGLVLNRSTSTRVGELVESDLPESLYDRLLFQGGPVQPGALSYLHTNLLTNESHIIPHLQVSHSLEDLIDMGSGSGVGDEIKIFAGYSGWGAGQLEDEMKRKSWLTHPASLDLVFYPSEKDLWKHILLKKGGIYKLLADSPEDYSLN